MIRRSLRRFLSWWPTKVVMALLTVVLGAALLLVYAQGPTPSRAGAVEVTWDASGIPTLEGGDWPALVQAQGYVVASRRLWQMDLMRRRAGGQLSAWFGSAALPVDQPRHEEDWAGVARRLADGLPPEERATCDAYAAGVNAWIDEHPYRWGLEYLLLQTRPEPWSCTDTLLIYLTMAETLSSSAEWEVQIAAWKRALPLDWAAFLFPRNHPWNEPLLGVAPTELPLPETAIPPRANLDSRRIAPAPLLVPGSNNWVWRGSTGAYVANDPHLAYTVPGLWFLVRLRVDAQDWVVGAALPGMPGVVLGRNARVAWAFTNLHEDVDDLLLIEVDEASSPPRWRSPGGEWAPLTVRTSTILVKDSAPVEVRSLWTPAGPARRYASLGDAWAVRQWLPFQADPQLARLPTLGLNRAADLDSLEAAIAAFPFPAQNIVFADSDGNIGYRASGTGITRSGDTMGPRRYDEGRWGALLPPETRPRLRIAATEPGPASIVTANQRIWDEAQDHFWASDRRAARIRELLAGRDDLSAADMERFQLDVHSRYLATVLQWVAQHATTGSSEAQARWSRWDGSGADPALFGAALLVDQELRALLLEQVRIYLLRDPVRDVPYSWSREDAWVLATLAAPDGLARFGLSETMVADWLMGVGEGYQQDYAALNHWRAQHAFVGRIPLVGGLFAVPEPPQVGWDDVVRVEMPRFGAGVRLLWDMTHPERSSWITPIGQSGHVTDHHYADLQATWVQGARLPVFPEGWFTAERSPTP